MGVGVERRILVQVSEVGLSGHGGHGVSRLGSHILRSYLPDRSWPACRSRGPDARLAVRWFSPSQVNGPDREGDLDPLHIEAFMEVLDELMLYEELIGEFPC